MKGAVAQTCFRLCGGSCFFGENRKGENDDGYYGIEEACQGYLGKSATEMSLADCTMMAGIPNAPSVYAPTVNPKLTRSRQEKVISDMVENSYLSEQDKNDLINKLDLI